VTSTVTLKLTETELGALDWLLATGQYTSRSDVLRSCYLETALKRGLQRGDRDALLTERQDCRPRQSALASTLQLRRLGAAIPDPTH
jgi:Arc/MetJ-type ribon-helix-helix transcriptional regulator